MIDVDGVVCDCSCCMLGWQSYMPHGKIHRMEVMLICDR